MGRPIGRVGYAPSLSGYGDDAPLPMREDLPLHPGAPDGAAKVAQLALDLASVNRAVAQQTR